jgi:hypothetical protein
MDLNIFLKGLDREFRTPWRIKRIKWFKPFAFSSLWSSRTITNQWNKIVPQGLSNIYIYWIYIYMYIISIYVYYIYILYIYIHIYLIYIYIYIWWYMYMYIHHNGSCSNWQNVGHPHNWPHWNSDSKWLTCRPCLLCRDVLRSEGLKFS